MLTKAQKLALDACHEQFLSQRSEALRLYEQFFELGFYDYLSLLRIIESTLERNSLDKLSTLRDRVDLLNKKFKIDAFGALAVSRFYSMEGNHVQAVELLIEATKKLPSNIWLRSEVCRRLIRLEEFDTAASEIERFSEDPFLDVEDVVTRLPSLRFQLYVATSDFKQLWNLISDIDFKMDKIEIWILAEPIYKFARTQHIHNKSCKNSILMIVDFLESKIHDSEQALFALLNYQSSLGNWKTSYDLIKQFDGREDYNSRILRIRLFECTCQLQLLDEANAIYENFYFDVSDLDATELFLIMTFLSEKRELERASYIAALIVRKGLSLSDVSGIYQVIRGNNRQLDFIKLIDESGRTDRFSLDLRQILVDDVCALSGQQEFAIEGSDRACIVSNDNKILTKPINPLGDSNFEVPCFICTDKTYFFSVFTLLASLSNYIDQRQSWFLFTADSVPEYWLDELESFCHKIQFSLTIVPELEFHNVSNTLKTAYGLFSGGRALSRAAYFRIYAAAWLIRQQKYKRAIYLDTDMICQQSLGSLLDLDFHGLPLAAKPEEINEHVRKAAVLCGVNTEDYINSGVLVFNFENNECHDLVKAAIWHSENSVERLTFHDQCALNIAFAGKIARIPDEFNFYLRPYIDYGLDIYNAGLLHYLDRPKPWEVHFRKPHRSPWVESANVVRALLPSRFYQDLVAASSNKLPL